MSYDLMHPRAPRLSGALLKAAAALLERPSLGKPLAHRLLKETGIDRFRRLHVPETPRMHPVKRGRDAATLEQAATPEAVDLESLAEKLAGFPTMGEREDTKRPAEKFRFPTIRDYAKAYSRGDTTPSEVCRSIIRTLREQDRGDRPLYLFIRLNEDEILAQAAESTRRFKEGNPRSLLEGVPVPIKDELDVAGFPTSLGTGFLTAEIAETDATVVARLREAGAILLGKANMHEIGMGVTGLNPNYGTPVNPYAPWRYPGGSSSGSAAAVALGLAPLAIGADGGGSIRIPAAFCGVAGLKPTFGRVSGRGSGGICWSVAHIGPIASSVEDLAVAYAAIAGPDEKDPWSCCGPSLGLDDVPTTVKGMKLGIYTPWFEDADEAILEAVRGALERLLSAGAELVEIEVPELENLRVAHLITISTEQRAAMDRHYKDHRTDFGIETRANLALAGRLTGSDYIKAQQMRERGLKQWNKIFEKVDAIITPTTGMLPPTIPEDRLLSGVSDLTTLSEIMRFVTPANLLGYPALSVPAGFVTADSRRFTDAEAETDHEWQPYSTLPVGVQFIAPHFQETRLLRLAAAVEAGTERLKPRIYFPSLNGR